MNLDKRYSGPEVTPEEILQSRTNRAIRQKELLQRGDPCLISFTLNIPGTVKQFPLAHQAFQVGLKLLGQELSPYMTHSILLEEKTGDEALICLSLPPHQVKQCTVKLEEYHPLGRLFDMDVLSSDGISLSRSVLNLPSRKCLLCGQDAKICARGQTHTMETLRFRVIQILEEYFRDNSADICAACAMRALLYEVSTTPKPGLVDRNNSGAHTDMDYFTFLDSSAALTPWFRKMFCIGWDWSTESTAALFRRLRFAGCQAEQDMFAATNGINTHKGLIFSMGLLCGAVGAIHKTHTLPLPADKVFQLCRELGKCSLEDFCCDNIPETNGLHCFHTLKITGVRGQAAQGFPSALEVGLPCLRHWTAQGLSLNDAGAITLIALLAQVEDTNLVHRGGADTATQCRYQARNLLEQLNQYNVNSLIERLDQEYTKKWLSPGGCADLLALSFMLLFMEQKGILHFSNPISKPF